MLKNSPSILVEPLAIDSLYVVLGCMYKELK